MAAEQKASRFKSNIDRRYDGDTPEERQLYVNRYNTDPANNPARLPPPLAPKPFANIDTLHERFGDGSREYMGLKTGFKEIDTLMSGIQAFTLFAGSGGTGKSTLALQLALGVIENEDCPVIYYSYEMPADDIGIMLYQIIGSQKKDFLTKEEILLHGNDRQRPEIIDKITRIRDGLITYRDKLYIIGSDAVPNLDELEDHIQQIKRHHQADKLLAVIDSVQDLIPESGGVEADIHTAGKIARIQQATGAVILGIAQKNKSGYANGGYGAILGSVSWIHKPTTVIEFAGIKEAIDQAYRDEGKSQEIRREKDSLYRLSDQDISQPVIARVIKGRNTGYGKRALIFHGKYGYFTAGRVRDYNTDVGLYDKLHFIHESAYQKAVNNS